MNAIQSSSGKMVDINAVIDSIAFQTNILVLNAAEVRNLAQRSAQSAREIKSLIEMSLSNVNLGTDLLTQAGSTMDELMLGAPRCARPFIFLPRINRLAFLAIIFYLNVML